MIVEDDADIRAVLQQCLELEGYSVVCACDGKQALDELASDPPKVILLDLMMPVMDGFEFLEAIAGDEELASIPVAIITAADRRVIALAERRPAVRAVFPKPLEMDAILEFVEKEAGERPREVRP